MLTQRLKHYSVDLMQRGLHRKREVNQPSVQLLNFSSNDYLSLVSHPCIKSAYQQGIQRYPVGSGGSMVVCGYHQAHKDLEQAFANALAVDDCLLFSSGYAANLSVIGLLGRLNMHLLIDKGVHASIYDGLTLSGARYSRFKHNDLDDLSLNVRTASMDTVLMTEGIFSMSGQLAPLQDIAHISQTQQLPLIVDEAHSFGLLGREGLGAVFMHHLTQKDVPLRVIPLGKAYGASGAIVAGEGAWIDALLQSARPHLYSTAMSPAFAYGLLETLEIVRGADERRAKLMELVDYFREAIHHSPLRWRESVSPIQQLQLGCPERALFYTEKLREQSILCLAMRRPTVSRQETGLRVILNYQHQPEDIDRLFDCLNAI